MSDDGVPTAPTLITDVHYPHQVPQLNNDISGELTVRFSFPHPMLKF